MKGIYYRLSGIKICVPSLANRIDDVPDLARYFAQKIAEKSGYKNPQFLDASMRALKKHSWPGNVRELENIVSAATVRTRDTGIITPQSLRLAAGESVTAGHIENALPIDATFGYKFNSHRELRGLTQGALAQLVSKSITGTISAEEVEK